MRLLANPVLLRMALLSVSAIAAFGLGWFVIRRIRRGLTSEQESIQHLPMASEGMPIHAFQAVIQQLKQQKHELATQQLSDRRKAKASDSLSSTVLANLSSGVLFVNTAGLVRQANPAARSLLGFASPVGLHLSELFRMASVRPQEGMATRTNIEQALGPAFPGKSAVRGLLFNYVTRNEESRVLEVAASPVMADDASLMGTTLILNDKTDIERLRHDRRGQRRNFRRDGAVSCAVPSRPSRKMRSNWLTTGTRNWRIVADKIAGEAEQLDRAIGRFPGGESRRLPVPEFSVAGHAITRGRIIL